MGRRVFKLAVRAASASAEAWASISNSLRSQVVTPPKAYQPERYYMRGPGPACREKSVVSHVTRRT